METPQKILVKDENGGYIIAEYEKSTEDADKNEIMIYKQVYYAHDLEMALRNM